MSFGYKFQQRALDRELDKSLDRASNEAFVKVRIAHWIELLLELWIEDVGRKVG